MSWIGDKIDHVDNPAAPADNARGIGVAFQPSATKYTWVSYSIQQTQTTGQDGNVQLLSDAANPPTTERASGRINNANAATHAGRVQLTYIVPPGHYVKLVAGGAGTNAIISQVEVPIS